jgi:hypothetical protein
METTYTPEKKRKYEQELEKISIPNIYKSPKSKKTVQLEEEYDPLLSDIYC